MWLPLQLTLEFLGRSLVWLAAICALGVAAACLVTAATRRPWRTVWPAMVLAAVVGALLGASLMDRFAWPEAVHWRIWRRSVPLTWSAGGALLGAVLFWAFERFQRARSAKGKAVDDFAALLTDPATTVAVVGATDDPAKFGGRIYRDLKGKGFRVLAVNPGRATVDGDPCYPSLAALPEKPTIVDLVVPPDRALGVLAECVTLGLSRVWLQPGSEDDAVLAFAAARGLTVRAHDCIMVKAAPLPSAASR
jgi:uncharacterized protein